MEKKPDIIQTERLTLKAFTEGHRQAMLGILFDKDIKKTYMLPDFDTPEQAGPLFEKLMQFSRSDNHFVYGICLNDTPIGFVNDCEITDSAIELGYVIAPAHQNKGFATEAVRACIDALFDMGFEEVKAGFFEENIASGRVMEKCGMVKMDLEEDIEYKGILRHCLYYHITKTKA